MVHSWLAINAAVRRVSTGWACQGHAPVPHTVGKDDGGGSGSGEEEEEEGHGTECARVGSVPIPAPSCGVRSPSPSPSPSVPCVEMQVCNAVVMEYRYKVNTNIPIHVDLVGAIRRRNAPMGKAEEEEEEAEMDAGVVLSRGHHFSHSNSHSAAKSSIRGGRGRRPSGKTAVEHGKEVTHAMACSNTSAVFASRVTTCGSWSARRKREKNCAAMEEEEASV